MPGICLPPQLTEKFKQALISGKINPEKLSTMTSEARHKLFSELVGEGNAKFVNSQFEAKTLLKNQQQGYLSWAKKLTGVTPEVRRDLISRISKMDKVLSPTEEKGFLKDLASTKLGIDVTAKEAKQIANMSSKLQELQTKQRPDGTFPSEADRLAYGHAKVDMGDYLASLKNNAEKQGIKQQLTNPVQLASKGAGLVKSIKATLDDSAIFRQGWKTMLTNPLIWQKNARKTFGAITGELQKKAVMREVKADIYSRPNYDRYQKMGISIGKAEEEYPSTLPEKIPLFGRVYKASESAYTGFLYRQRADIADKYLEIAKTMGVDTNNREQLQKIGKVVDALTGRGNLGRFEGTAADTLNNVFFSARFLKSNIDTLTAHQLQKGTTLANRDPGAVFARRTAATNLVKIISGIAGIMYVANAMKPGSAELDPRSKDFGKIKVGDTRFDISGGMGSLVVLAAQLIKQETKNANTGIVNKLNSGFGSDTGAKVVQNFITGKLSPAAAFFNDAFVNHADFQGKPLTVAGEAKNLLVPLPITTYFDTKADPQAANALLIQIADGFGLSASTSGKSSKDPTVNQSSTSKAFQQKVGDAKFNQATKDYNTRVDKWLAANKGRLNAQPPDKQKSLLNAAKTKIQKQVYKDNGFKPPHAKPSAQDKQAKKSLLESIN